MIFDEKFSTKYDIDINTQYIQIYKKIRNVFIVAFMDTHLIWLLYNWRVIEKKKEICRTRKITERKKIRVVDKEKKINHETKNYSCLCFLSLLWTHI